MIRRENVTEREISDCKSISDVEIQKDDNLSLGSNHIYVSMGRTCVCNNSDTLWTNGLASCYALIVFGKKENGQVVVALNHWIGDEDSAGDVITNLQYQLLQNGVTKSSLQCLAIGGHENFPETTNQIKLLQECGTIQYSHLDLNKGENTSDLIININETGILKIKYAVRQTLESRLTAENENIKDKSSNAALLASATRALAARKR